jgi:hypothetical protein
VEEIENYSKENGREKEQIKVKKGKVVPMLN